MAIYLSQASKPDRITPKQLAGFMRAQKEGFSHNDGYNKQFYHLDRATYLWIREAVSSLYGMSGTRPKLAEVNKWLANPTWLTDEEGNYTTYMGNTIRVA